MSENKEDKIRRYALKNAVKFDGEASVGPVMSKVMGEFEEMREDPGGTKELVGKMVDEVNKISFEDQKKELKEEMPQFFEEDEEEERNRLPELDSEDVVMRMAPYPSGPLHIGNARMVLLNDEYVKRNDGKLILFFDDTIGSEEKKPLSDAYDMIKDGLDWLDVDYHEIYYKSERMETYYEYGEKIIEMGEAYVCECRAEELRKKREKGEKCEHRDRSIEDNLKHWNEMLNGTFNEGEAVVRLKTDMEHSDPAFRDRVLFRIAEKEHPRVGMKYHVWPLLEFSWAIDDYQLGITHILRGKDLVIEDRMEEYIWDLFGWEGGEFLHYGMLRLKDVKLSKSEFQNKIQKGGLRGWDDPRTWSLQSLERRGIQPEAIRDFILDFGMSKTDIEVPPSKLYSKNREIIDSRANRYFFVKDPVKIKLGGEVEGGIETQEAKIPRHPEFSERGNRVLKSTREVWIPRKEWEANQGEEIRLKNLFNIELEGDEEKEEKKGKITNSGRRDLIKIQWLPRDGDELEAVVEHPDGKNAHGLVEKNVEEVNLGDIVQFERYGFVKIHEKEPILASFGHR